MSENNEVKVSNSEETSKAGSSLLQKTRESLPSLLQPRESQIWKSVFRHKLDDKPRNRSLAVLSNVFLHLHPARINRDAVKYAYTWGMGGITFFLFIIL